MRRKHQRRVLINLLVIAVLALFLWVHEGCHLPTLEMELHRTERQRLMEKSRVIWTYEGRAYNDRDMLVGVTGNSIHAYSEVYGLDIWPRSVAEPTLVILPDRTRYTAQGGSYLGPALLAVDPPAGAETSQQLGRGVCFHRDGGAGGGRPFLLPALSLRRVGAGGWHVDPDVVRLLRPRNLRGLWALWRGKLGVVPLHPGVF